MKHGTMYRKTDARGWDSAYRLAGSQTLAVGRIGGDWYVVDVSAGEDRHRVGAILGTPWASREDARAAALLIAARRGAR
jgi:hypothetical protein